MMLHLDGRGGMQTQNEVRILSWPQNADKGEAFADVLHENASEVGNSRVICAQR